VLPGFRGATFFSLHVFLKTLCMKKVTLFIFLLLPSCLLTAQTDKGDQTVSGLMNGWINRSSRGFSASIDGIYQYFIFKNMSVGAGAQFNIYHFRYRSENYNYPSYYFLPEARYYFFREKFRPYVYANGGFGYIVYPKYPEYNIVAYKYGTGVGFSWFFTDRLALESRFGIHGYGRKGSKPAVSDLVFKIGVQYSIPSRKKQEVPTGK
jgi:hypothetical protein